MRLVAADPGFKRLLIASIERAKQINPDPVTNPAQSLEQYYDFISWAERALPGDLAKVKPDATMRRIADTRSILLDTEQFGLVALLPIGMSPVSSVNFDASLKEGVRVRKGDRMGHFLFGGSDFVMVFQRGYAVTADSPRDPSGKGYSRVLMGERLGQLRAIK